MSGRSLLKWGALLALAAAGAPAGAVTLRYQATAPGSGRYALSVESETRSVGPGNRLEVTKAKARINGEVRALAAAEPDRFDMACRVSGGRVFVLASGMVRRHAAPTATQRVIVSARGETLDWQTPQGLLVELEPPSRLMLEPADVGLLEGYGALPEGDVKPGDTWSGVYEEPPGEPGGKPTRVRYTSQLLGIAEFRGRPCARIATEYQVVEEPEDEAPSSEESSLTMEMDGHLIWGFDIERGAMLYYAENMTMVSRLNMVQRGGAFAATITTRIRLTSYAIPPGEQP